MLKLAGLVGFHTTKFGTEMKITYKELPDNILLLRLTIKPDLGLHASNARQQYRANLKISKDCK